MMLICKLNGTFMKRLLFVLLLPLALGGMQPRDNGGALPPPAKKVCVRAHSPCADAPAADQPRVCATLVAITSDTGTSQVAIDNGAMPDTMARVLHAKKAAVLLNSTLALPFLLMSFYKNGGANCVGEHASSSPASETEEQPLDAIIACWDELIDNATTLDSRIALIKKIKELANRDEEGILEEVGIKINEHTISGARHSFNEWFDIAMYTDFAAIDVYTIAVMSGKSHFVLLVPRGYVAIEAAFPGAAITKHEGIFSDEAALKGVLQLLIEEQDTESGEKTAVHLAFDELFGRGTAYRWNIFFEGHGAPACDVDMVVGMPLDNFLKTIDVCRERIGTQVNFLAWRTCFGGGLRARQVCDHLKKGGTCMVSPFSLISLNPFDAVTSECFRSDFFTALDHFSQRFVQKADDTFFAEIFKAINGAPLLVLKAGACDFDVIDTRQKIKGADEVLLAEALHNACEDAGKITSETLMVIACCPGYVSAQRLYNFLDVIEHTLPRRVSCPRGVLRARAYACKNVYMLTSLAEAGVAINDLAMSDDLAQKANQQGAVACRFVAQLCGSQRQALMACAVRNNLYALIAALLSVQVALPDDYTCTEALVAQLYALPEHLLADALSLLHDRQREQVAALAHGTYGAQDVVAQALQNPLAASPTPELIALLEKLPERILRAFVEKMYALRGSAWFEAAVINKATVLFKLLIEKRVYLRDEAINEAFAAALCVEHPVHYTYFYHRFMAWVPDSQRVTLYNQFCAFYQKEMGNARMRVKRTNALQHMFMILSVAPLAVSLPVCEDNDVVAVVENFMYNPEILFDMVAHMNDRQIEQLRKSMMKQVSLLHANSGKYTCTLADFFEALVAFVRSPACVSLPINPVLAGYVDQLPEAAVRRVLRACPESVRASLVTYSNSLPLYARLSLKLYVDAGGAAWGLLQHCSLDEALIRTVIVNKAYAYFADKQIDVLFALSLEKVLEKVRSDGSGLLAALRDDQRAALARIAVLFNLDKIKDLFEGLGIALPPGHTLHVDMPLACSLPACCALDPECTFACWLNRMHARELAQCLASAPLGQAGDVFVMNLLTTGVSDPRPQPNITPAMVTFLATLPNEDEEYKNAINAMTYAQKQQTARCAQFFNFSTICALLESAGVPVPTVTSIGVDQALVRALNELSFSAIRAVIKRLSPDQQVQAWQCCMSEKLHNVLYALVLQDAIADDDVARAVVEVKMVTAFAEDVDDELVGQLMKRFNKTQLDRCVYIAALCRLQPLLDRLYAAGVERVDADALTVDVACARSCALVDDGMLKNVVEKLNARQQDQLYAHAQAGNIERVLMHMAAVDARRFALDMIPLSLEELTDEYVQAKVIASLTAAQRTLLAALARVFDLKNIEKQLFLQDVPVPTLDAIVIDENFVRCSNDCRLSVAAIDQLNDDQLTRLYQLARAHRCTHILLLFDPAFASPRMQVVVSRIQSEYPVVDLAIGLLDDTAVRSPWRDVDSDGDGVL